MLLSKTTVPEFAKQSVPSPTEDIINTKNHLSGHSVLVKATETEK